jgi:hypothetical protein
MEGDMKKSEMVCQKCINFEKNRKVCKGKPGQEIVIENPKENWCGEGTWGDPYDNAQLLYWGQWAVLEQNKIDRLREAWHRLRVSIDKKDGENINFFAQNVLSRTEGLTTNDIIEALGDEAPKYFAWRDAFFDKASEIDFKVVEEDAKDYNPYK